MRLTELTFDGAWLVRRRLEEVHAYWEYMKTLPPPKDADLIAQLMAFQQDFYTFIAAVLYGHCGIPEAYVVWTRGVVIGDVFSGNITPQQMDVVVMYSWAIRKLERQNSEKTCATFLREWRCASSITTTSRQATTCLVPTNSTTKGRGLQDALWRMIWRRIRMPSCM